MSRTGTAHAPPTSPLPITHTVPCQDRTTPPTASVIYTTPKRKDQAMHRFLDRAPGRTGNAKGGTCSHGRRHGSRRPLKSLIVARRTSKARCITKKARNSRFGTGCCGAEGDYPKMSSSRGLSARTTTRAEPSWLRGRKPNSVPPAIAGWGRRSFLWDARRRAPQARYPSPRSTDRRGFGRQGTRNRKTVCACTRWGLPCP